MATINLPSMANNKQRKKKVIVATIAVGAAGIAGFFAWQYYRKKKQAAYSTGTDYSQSDFVLPSATSAVQDSVSVMPEIKSPKRRSKKTVTSASSDNAISTASDFPLKKGSKGEKVRLLQQAIISKYGKSALPKFGADGDFGSETVAALRKAGFPSSVDESTFNVLTQAVQSAGASLGAQLYAVTIAHDFDGALSYLKEMNNTADYSSANAVFKQKPVGNVRQTIVNGLLNTFTDDDQKEKIKKEFLRIGLQFNGSKWSLSGFGGNSIITICPALIWVNARKRVAVPARVILGNEISRKLDYTLFENQGRYFLVPSACVRYF